MSAEKPMIPIFQGLEGFDDLMSRMKLAVRPSLGAPQEILEPGWTIRKSSHEFRKLGLELVSDWDQAEIEAAARQADLGVEEIAVVVVAEDGFLKERVILLGPAPMSTLLEPIKLAAYNGDRPDVLRNSETGFSLEAHLVLTKGRAAQPLRPHRKGTILASAEFSVRSTRNTGGLDPKPLTEEKIAEFGLSPKAVLYLDYDSPIVELEHLDGSLDVYLNETLLNAAGRHRSDERDAVMTSLALEALCQIVFIVSAELQDTPVPEADRSAVLRMIRSSLHEAGRKLSIDEVGDLVKNEPAKVAGWVSGTEQRARQLLKVVAGDDDTENRGEE